MRDETVRALATAAGILDSAIFSAGDSPTSDEVEAYGVHPLAAYALLSAHAARIYALDNDCSNRITKIMSEVDINDIVVDEMEPKQCGLWWICFHADRPPVTSDLKRQLKAHGISAAALAARLGVSAQAVSLWTTGKDAVPSNRNEQIQKIFREIEESDRKDAQNGAD